MDILSGFATHEALTSQASDGYRKPHLQLERKSKILYARSAVMSFKLLSDTPRLLQPDFVFFANSPRYYFLLCLLVWTFVNHANGWFPQCCNYIYTFFSAAGGPGIAVFEIPSGQSGLHKSDSNMFLHFLSKSSLSLSFFSMVSFELFFQSCAKHPLKPATLFSPMEPAKIDKRCWKNRLHATFGLSRAWKNQKCPDSNPSRMTYVVSETSLPCIWGKELCS